jgi:glutathione S-transferase
MRARMALALLETQIELREVLLGDKPPSMLEVSPKGTVPVFILTDGQVIEESLDLMVWAIEKNCSQWIEIGGLARQKSVIEQFDLEFKPLLDAYKYDRGDALHPAHFYRDAATKWLDKLEQCLVGQKYLLGHRPQMQDLALMPFIRQFAFVDKAWFDAQPRANLNSWLDRWLHNDLFTSVMKKYPVWQEKTCGEIWLGNGYSGS